MLYLAYIIAARLHGFLRKNPNPSPDQIRRWMEIIFNDQSKNDAKKSRFSGFKRATAASLRRYEADIDVLAADGMGERAIHSALKKRYLFAKNIPSASTIRRFLERKNG